MNKKLECFHPEINSKKCLSSVINTKNSFSQDGRYLNGMKKSQRMIKHENMTKITMLSIIFYLVLPATFLYQRISPFLVILTVYLWFMTLWFLCKVRQQDPGIVPRLELLEGVRRLWNWRFQDKLKLIQGNTKACGRIQMESDRSLGDIEDGSSNDETSEVIFKTRIEKLELQELDIDHILIEYNSELTALNDEESQLRVLKTHQLKLERNQKIEKAFQNMYKHKRTTLQSNVHICRTCRIFKPQRCSHCK